MEICLARQPIFDPLLEVQAYEILFRDGLGSAFVYRDGTGATRQVMVNSLILTGLQTLTGGRRAFINVTRDILLGEYIQLFPPAVLVADIAETIEADDHEAIDACAKLKNEGYEIALNDFMGFEDHHPLIPLVDIARIDFHNTSSKRRQALLASFRKQNKGADLLAERVETQEEFEEALDEEFTLFQGYFFAKPELVRSKEIPGSKMHYLRLLRELHQPEMRLDGLEHIIRQDMSLSYRLLKYINSAFFGWRSEVKSIRHALSLLGERDIRKWASLVALSYLGEDKPIQLLLTGLIRAAFGERLAAALGRKEDAEALFMVGMFSVIDALLDRPLEEALRTLAIAPAVHAALLGKPGLYRGCLDLILAFELGAWDKAAAIIRALSLPDEQVGSMYVASVEWAEQCLSTDVRPEKGRPAG